MLTRSQIEVIAKTPMFLGLTPAETEEYLRAGGHYPAPVKAGEALVYQGEENGQVFILLSGRAVGERLYREGKLVTVNEFAAGSVFGDVISSGERVSPVTVSAAEDSLVLRIPFSAIVAAAGGSRTGEEVLKNLIEEIAGKYFTLMERLDMLLCPTLRGKISAYLLSCMDKGGGAAFTCPHTREEQARLLNCDRSALSRELSRMRAEGLIEYGGRRFEIKNRPALEALI